MIPRKIYLKKVRTLSEIFSASFGFIKQNFRPLYGSIFLFAGPFLLASSVISSYMLGSSIGLGNIFKSREGIAAFYGRFLTAYLATVLVMFIGVTVYTVILNRNVLENEKLKDGEDLQLKSGISSFWPDFWRLLANTFLLIVTLVIVMLVFVLIFAGLIALVASDGGTGGGTVLVVILVLVLLALVFILGPVISYVVIASMFVSQRDEINIFPAIRKTMYYMRENFWSTWAVSMVGLLTNAGMNLVVQIPVIIVTVISSFSRLNSGTNSPEDFQSASLLLIVVTAISHLLSYGVQVTYHLIIIYQYCHLEEKKEGISIEEKINQIQ
jgi:hypothetical protein